jgi:predicted nucleic acid-binding protein
MPGASDTSRGVLDASVAIRWLVDEIGSAEARDLVEAMPSWIAPHLLMTECAAALRRKVVAAELTAAEAFDAVEILKRAVDEDFVRLADDRGLVIAALSLAFELEHKLPDCMYLALAEREGITLATADRTLARLARRRGASCSLVPSR